MTMKMNDDDDDERRRFTDECKRPQQTTHDCPGHAQMQKLHLKSNTIKGICTHRCFHKAYRDLFYSSAQFCKRNRSMAVKLATYMQFAHHVGNNSNLQAKQIVIKEFASRLFRMFQQGDTDTKQTPPHFFCRLQKTQSNSNMEASILYPTPPSMLGCAWPQASF